MAGGRSLERVVRLVDHAKFQRRGLAQDLLDLGGVLQPRQLNGDPIDALARHLRLGHCELGAVQAVAQNDDVLLHGIVLPVLDFLRREHELERRRAIDRHIGQIEVAVVGEDGRLALAAAVVVAEQHAHAVRRIVHLNILIRNARASQRGAEILFPVVELLLHGAGHVDLIHEVDAAPQVEAELQRVQAEVAHPIGYARGLRERDGEVVLPGFRDDVARLQLVLLGGEAQCQTALIQEGSRRLDALRLEQSLDVGAVGRQHRGAVARQLQRAFLAEQIREAPGKSRSRARSQRAQSSSAGRKSCALDRPLGEKLRNLEFLQLDVHAVRDL